MKSRTSQCIYRSGAVLGLVMALAVTAAWARDGGGSRGEGRFERRLEHMARELGLSETQRVGVEGIMSAGREQAQPYVEQLKAARESMRPLIEAETLDESAVRALAASKGAAMVELAVIRARGRHQVRALLTPEQREQLEAIHARGGEHHRHGRPPRGE